MVWIDGSPPCNEVFVKIKRSLAVFSGKRVVFFRAKVKKSGQIFENSQVLPSTATFFCFVKNLLEILKFQMLDLLFTPIKSRCWNSRQGQLL